MCRPQSRRHNLSRLQGLFCKVYDVKGSLNEAVSIRKGFAVEFRWTEEGAIWNRPDKLKILVACRG